MIRILQKTEKEKPHYHVILSYKGNKSFEQIDEIARLLHAPIPQRVNSLTGAVRYLTHMDNPEKYQYESSDIRLMVVLMLIVLCLCLLVIKGKC